MANPAPTIGKSRWSREVAGECEHASRQFFGADRVLSCVFCRDAPLKATRRASKSRARASAAFLACRAWMNPISSGDARGRAWGGGKKKENAGSRHVQDDEPTFSGSPPAASTQFPGRPLSSIFPCPFPITCHSASPRPRRVRSRAAAASLETNIPSSPPSGVPQADHPLPRLKSAPLSPNAGLVSSLAVLSTSSSINAPSWLR
jgi:hypothetical protein